MVSLGLLGTGRGMLLRVTGVLPGEFGAESVSDEIRESKRTNLSLGAKLRNMLEIIEN